MEAKTGGSVVEDIWVAQKFFSEKNTIVVPEALALPGLLRTSPSDLSWLKNPFIMMAEILQNNSRVSLMADRS